MYDKCVNFVNECNEGNLCTEMDVIGKGNMNCDVEIVLNLKLSNIDDLNRTIL